MGHEGQRGQLGPHTLKSEADFQLSSGFLTPLGLWGGKGLTSGSIIYSLGEHT